MINDNFKKEQWDLFTDELKNIFKFIEETLVFEHPIAAINDSYFILAIFQETESFAYKIFNALLSNTAINLIHDAYFRIVINKQLTTIKPNKNIPIDSNFNTLIDEAIEEMKKIEDEKLSSIHIMLALINPEREHNNVQKIMKSAGFNYKLLTNKLLSLKNEDYKIEEQDNNINNKSNKEKKKTEKYILKEYNLEDFTSKSLNGQYLKTYCINLNKKVKEGKIDPVIGRDKEIERISNIFNRRRKNNVVIVGDKGSGKTAICESLAWLIENNQAPYSLKDKTILKLDVASMIAGTTYRGMFEERAKGVFSELQKNPNYILFIDDFHNHTQKKDLDSSTDITPYLKESISDGSVKIITTCTPKGFHKKFDADQSLLNKFQRVDLTQLDDKKIKEILMNIKNIYEEFHSIKISEEIIDLCILLCKKYITDKEMPDSVIDLIDEIGACVSEKYIEHENVKKIKNEINELTLKKEEAFKKENFDEVDFFMEEINKNKSLLKKEENKKQINKVVITENIVYNIISDKTGIPIQNLSQENKKDLSELNNRIKEVVIGQDEAIDKICKTIKRKRLGLYNGRSTAILCQGKSGVGKTLIAKELAKELFGSVDAMVRFDMSEYADKTSVNKLIGSSAGYVGYEEGGLLTEAIKNKKHCILLLDEIEKAHNEIFNIFLQVFDEGFLTDNIGQKVDFRNVIILLTSNVGAKEATLNGKSIGFNANNQDKSKSILDKELKKKFAPEFLNRLDGIIFFNSLNEENLKKIIKLEINKSIKRFKDINYIILYNDNIIDYIYNIIKEESEYGARPIIRAIQTEIEEPLTDIILDNDENKIFNLELIDNKINFNIIKGDS